MPSLIFWIPVGVLGLITGSFLNAVIHRLPRGISLLHPKRSFCPNCQKTIPWHENLPVASWVLLRGHCSGCALPISIRYPLVELLTGGLYLMAWGRFGLPLGPIFWVFLSLLVAATFIDFDHLIIPDEITLGGTVAGLTCATLMPSLFGVSLWWQGLLLSGLGAVIGFGVLWVVVEIGKRALGRHTIRPEVPLPFTLERGESSPVLMVGEESLALTELFYRESDRVEALCLWLEIAGERLGPGRLTLDSRNASYEGREWPLASLNPKTETGGEAPPLRAEISELILPREAMGFGDVKFLACIGAFIGWKGVFFSLFAGSLIGALVGVVMLLATRGRSGGRIPFGPYLALGAALWIFAGPELLAFYLSRLHG